VHSLLTVICLVLHSLLAHVYDICHSHVGSTAVRIGLIHFQAQRRNLALVFMFILLEYLLVYLFMSVFVVLGLVSRVKVSFWLKQM